MTDKYSVNIGDVRFHKSDVKSSGKIERDGKTLNSVFLKDGTNVVFPNQNKNNKSQINQHFDSHTEMIPSTQYNPSTGQSEFVYTPTTVTDYDKHVTTAEKIKSLEITGTKNEDKYILAGCVDSKVDVSQNDGKYDSVSVVDLIRGNMFESSKSASSGNTVKLGKNDVATFNKPAAEVTKWYHSDSESIKGPGTAKERK